MSLRKRIRSNVSELLAHPTAVVMALLRYTDWWQPGTASVIQVGAARRNSSFSDGIPSGLLATLDERTELCRRMQQVSEAERNVLYLWYVRQLAVDEIGHELRISRRQCFRRRSSAIQKIVELGEPDRAA
jgi:DNA-directed RNA polymerase specialized sigma24 family protein